MYVHLLSLMAYFLAEQSKVVPVYKTQNPLTIPTKPAIKTTLKSLDIAQDCVDSRLRAGRCVSLSRCPDMVEEFYNEARKNSYGIDFQTFISNSICGFDGSNFLICCRTQLSSTSQSQVQTSSITFGATSSPAAPQTQSSVFLFAPLGGYNPSTPIATQTPPPASNYVPPFTYPSVSYPNLPNTNPIVFQPPAQNTPSTSVFQPIPNAPGTSMQGGGLIYQPAPNPLATNAPIQPQTGGWDNTCGISKGTTNRVVGGGEAKKGSYPWMAALGYRDEYSPSTLKYLCGGSLISPKYVISSAHCVNANLLVIRLGAHDLSNPAEASAADYRIRRTQQHEGFNLKTIANDIALIELAQLVTMTNFITPICLPEASSFSTQDFVGMNPFVAGWGATKHQGITSNVLRDVQVPIVSRQTCEQSYRTVFSFVEFSEKLICAGSSNVDACQGDSGGPLMLPQMDATQYRYYLLGIVSYGYECARSGFPGVYTRVASYMPWIKQNMV